MVKIVNVCSGKGGVGKTSVAINLGAALHTLNKRTIIVDCNLTTSHLGLVLGIYSTERTLNKFLKGEGKIEDAVHQHKSGISIVPASLELNELAHIKTEGMKAALKEAFVMYDFVLLDSAPGIGREALIALNACDEALFVSNPYIPSVVDVLKTKKLAGKMGFYNAGIILNRVRGRKYEISKDEVFRFTDMPVVGIIPEDESVLKATNERSISFVSYPKSPSSRAFFELAHTIAGLPYYRRRG